jgi:hypothetical protein
VNSPREIFERQYKAAAAEGALYELYMRLLATRCRSYSNQHTAKGSKALRG